MKDRETLDEAIDRVAARMTQAHDGDIAPVWTAPVRTTWVGWRVAGALGVCVLVVGLAVTNLFRMDERREVPAIGAAPLVAWDLGTPEGVPYVRPADRVAARVGHRFSGAEVTRSDLGTPEGVPYVRGAGRDARFSSESFAIAGEEFDSPDTLATLDVAPVSVPALRIEETDALAPLFVPDLVIAAPSDGSSPRE